jgi:hypothetical protein
MGKDLQEGTMINLQSLPNIIMAVGGLGTAAFGLVDSTKVFWGGVNRIGFKRISGSVKNLTTHLSAGLNQDRILGTLRANWYNGTALNDQKSIAKSLIKQGLNPANALDLTAQTGVDKDLLNSVATKIQTGTALLQPESDVYSRFDFVLTALFDEVYQHADQAYTNWTRVWASGFALVLGFVGGWTLNGCSIGQYWWTHDMWIAVVSGLLATPLAPVAKDLSSALATAVNTMQIIKK